MTPALGEKEASMVELVTQKELEGSMLSDHELKARSDKLREERKKAKETVPSSVAQSLDFGAGPGLKF
mgnify:CR=1 FL=1